MPRVHQAALAVGTTAVLLGPASYSLATVNQSFSGPLAAAGPVATSTARAFGPAGGPGGAGTAGASTSSQLISYLEQNQGRATWLVAVRSAMSAATIQLATGKPVLAMGGFSGSDAAPTASQLASLGKSGQLRFVLLGAGGGGFGGAAPGTSDGGTQQATQWVQSKCTQVTTAGVSGLYDCSSAAG